MPQVKNDPEIVKLLLNPTYRRQFQEQLSNSREEDGTRKIIIKDEKGNVVRTLTAFFPKLPA